MLRLSRWFGVIEVNDDLAAPVVACLTELVEMLDTVDPSRVDRLRSAIRSKGHGWTVPGGVAIHLAHESDENGDLDIVVGDREAIVSWLFAHEHVFPEDGDDARPWPTVVVDLVAAALKGEYEVENHWRGERLTKTRVVDVADRAGRRVVSSTGSLFGWLPWSGRKRVEVHRLDFGAGRGPSSGPVR